MSRNKLYTERLEICITKQQKKHLELEAKNQEKTMNEILRQIITENLN